MTKFEEGDVEENRKFLHGNQKQTDSGNMKKIQ